jgi:cytochrome b561
MIRNSFERWGSISIALHWLSAILIVSLAIIGLTMSALPSSSLKLQVYALHKSFGLTVLALTVLRLLWRCLSQTPKALPNTAPWQIRIANTVHALLYVLLFAIPLSGWLYNSASGFPLRWFGLVSLPKLFTGFNPNLKHFAHNAHETLFYVLAVLLLVHASAALYHHHWLGDNTLKRMLRKNA